MLPNRDLDIKALRSFILAHELGSFSAAALALHCTQAALSLRIKKLEQTLGVTLFHRNYHHLVLTRIGERCLKEALRVLQTHDHLLQQASRDQRRETLRLGVPEDVTRPLFDGFISRQQHINEVYDLEITLRLCRELIGLVDAAELDMSVVTLFPGEAHGDFIALKKVRWVCSPDFTLQKGDSIPLALYPEGCIYRAHVLPILEAIGWPYRIVFSAQGGSSVQAAVAAGMGLTLIAEGMIPPGLRVAPPCWNLPSLGVTEVRLIKSHHLSPAGLRFADELKKSMASI